MSLANNHSIDYGEQGLLQTFSILKQCGIEYFGAGENPTEAGRPCIIRLNGSRQSKTLALLSGFQYRYAYNRYYKAYASEQHAGVQPLREDSIGPWIQQIRAVYAEFYRFMTSLDTMGEAPFSQIELGRDRWADYLQIPRYTL